MCAEDELLFGCKNAVGLDEILECFSAAITGWDEVGFEYMAVGLIQIVLDMHRYEDMNRSKMEIVPRAEITRSNWLAMEVDMGEADETLSKSSILCDQLACRYLLQAFGVRLGDLAAGDVIIRCWMKDNEDEMTQASPSAIQILLELQPDVRVCVLVRVWTNHFVLEIRPMIIKVLDVCGNCSTTEQKAYTRMGMVQAFLRII